MADHLPPRTRLLATTALVAAFAGAARPAAAQIAPNARPLGGTVVAGEASIATSPTATTVTQNTPRAAVNWQSFDVGARQTVQFRQPSSQAVILNRVTGPDPSVIAGRIDANGQVVITNASGVSFSRGAEVNAQSLVVSAPGITNRNFMAGRMVFDQPASANGFVRNDGTISVRQAGLAALVAPAVRNGGVINAKLGRVVLAGARAATLDMYGDGLVSIDVSGEVTQAPVGHNGRPVTALVTNTGTILADGGTVQLTAAAADGVVQRLVDARGLVRADTTGGRTGTITIGGVGGAVEIDGTVAADGGPAGGNGGTVAIGTTAARAAAIGSGTYPAGTSPAVTIDAGARVSADGTGTGNGGRIAVLSTRETSVAGHLSVRGGARGGHGGIVELSGQGGFALSGTVDAGAALGQYGTIVLDPTDLTIGASPTLTPITPGTGNPAIGYGEPPAEASVSASALQALTGTIDLQATNDLTVASSVSLGTGTTLRLEAGNNLVVEPGYVVNAGSIDLEAAAATAPGPNLAGSLLILGDLAANFVTLHAGTGGITLAGSIGGPSGSPTGNATGVTIATTGTFSNGNGGEDENGGQLGTSTLSGSAGAVALAGVVVGTIGALTATGSGGISIDALAPGTLTVAGPVTSTAGGGVALTNSLGDIDVAGTVSAPSVSLVAPGGTITEIGGIIDAGTLTLAAATASLLQPNAVATLGPSTVTNNVALNDAGGLTVAAGSTLGGGEGGQAVIDAAGGLTIGGSLAAGPLVLAAGPAGIAIDAPVTLPLASGGDLVVETPGPVSEGGAGAVTAFQLSGSASAIDLGSTGNDVAHLLAEAPDIYPGTVDLQTAGAFRLVEASGGTLAIGTGGTLLMQVGSNATLIADSFALDANASGPPMISAGGTIAFAPATAGRDVDVSVDGEDDESVQIATGNRLLFSSDAVAIGVPDHPAGTIGFFGALDLGFVGIDHLVLDGTGAVTETGPLTLGTLGGTAASFALTQANTIGALSGLATTGGPIGITDAGTLAVTGPVNAGTAGVTLEADGTGTALLLAAEVDAGVLELDAPNGTVAQTGGLLAAATLNGTAGDFDLPSAGNRIGTLGALNAGGIDLTDAGSLVLGGSLTAGTLALTLPGGTLTTTGTVSGSIGTLTGTADAVAIALSDEESEEGGLLTVATLGPWKTTNGFSFSDVSFFNLENNTPLVVAGPITDGRGISIESAGTVTVTGALQAPTIAITADGFGPFDEAGDGSGGLTVAGGATLAGASGVTLAASNALTLQAGSAVLAPAGEVTLNSGGALTLGGTISAPGVFLEAAVETGQAAGSITQTGGAIDAGTLSGTAAGTLSLATTGNNIAAIGTLLSNGGLTLADAAPVLTIAGTLADPTSVTLAGPAAIALAGTLNSTAIDLVDTGAVTGAGVLGTETLSGTALSISLLGAGNSLDALAGLTATGGGLAVADAFPLTVTGPVAVAPGNTLLLRANDFGIAPGGTLTAPEGTVAIEPASGALTVGSAGELGADPAIDAATLQLGAPGGGPVTISGTFAPGGVAALDVLSAGTLGETGGGALTVGTLDASVAAVTLQGNNAIGTLGAITATGAGGIAVLATGGPLTIAGPLLAPAGPVSITDSDDADPAFPSPSGSMTVAGAITAASVSLASGALTQIGGSTITAAGAATLTALDLALAGTISAATVTLHAFDVPNDEGGVGLAGSLLLASGATIGATTVVLASDADATVEAGAALHAVTGATITAGGSLVLAGAVSALGLALGATSLTEPAGGAITAGTLTAAVTNGLALGGTGNAIASFGSLSAGGAITLADAAPATLTGPVTAGGTLTLAVANLAEAPGGSITATALAGSAGALALLSPANAIGTLGALAAAGTLALADAAALTVGGPVSAAGTLALRADSIGFAPGGTLAAPGGVVSLAPLADGGSIALGAAGGFVGAAAPINAGTLAVGDADTGGITIAGTFDLAGVPVLDLVAAGTIAEAPGGALRAGTLDASGAAIELAGANVLAALGDVATPGALVLDDTTALALAGDITAGSARLVVGGALTQTGGTLASGSLATAATGAVSIGETGVAQIGTLDGSSAGTRFALLDATPLTLAGTLAAPVLLVEGAGTLVLAGDTILTTDGTLAAVDPPATPTMLDQTGTTTIGPATPGGPSAILLALSGADTRGGTMNFNDLEAPNSAVTLAPGQGTASGTINAGALTVEGGGGSSDLQGSVGGQTGNAAAANAVLTGGPDPLYLLDGCPIGEACGAAPISPVSPAATDLTDTDLTAAILTPDYAIDQLLALPAADANAQRRQAKRPLLVFSVLDLSIGAADTTGAVELPNISSRDY